MRTVSAMIAVLALLAFAHAAAPMPDGGRGGARAAAAAIGNAHFASFPLSAVSATQPRAARARRDRRVDDGPRAHSAAAPARSSGGPAGGAARSRLALPAAFLPSPLAAATDTAPEAVAVELRLGRIAVRTVEAYRVGDEALIPLSQFFDMAGVRATISSAGLVQAMLQPGDVPLVIDVSHDVATFGRRQVTVPARLRLEVNGEVFYSATALGELLDAPMYVDWPELQVVMRDAGPLPLAQELRRRAARAALERERGPLAAGLRIPLERRRWDGFVLDYSILSPSSDPLGGSSYSAQGGADLLGGSLEFGASSLGRAAAGNVRVDASWLGVWRDNPLVKQLRLGDGLTTGPRPRGMRGVSLTNAPFVRPSLLGTVPYAGRLPPGWEVEAYRGGQLIAFDSTDDRGDYAVSLPVLYGENPVQFVAYGPYGETRVFGRTYHVSADLLPVGQFEYAFAGGQCRFYSCAATGNLDLRYGITRRWTVQAGADRYWRDSLPSLFHPYAGVTGSVTNALTVRAEGVAHAFVRSSVAYEPSLDTRLSAEYTRFDTGTISPLLTVPGQRTLSQFSAFYRPVRAKDFLYFEAGAERLTTVGLTTDRAHLGASVQFGAIRVLPYVRLERETPVGGSTSTHGYWGFNASVLPRRSWGSLLGLAFMRGTIETQDLSAVTLASVAIARPLTPLVRLEMGVSWIRGSAGPAYTLSLASYLHSFRAYTTASAQRGTPASASQLVQGSLLYDRSSHAVHLAPGPSLQRAGVAGRVFLDNNGNGRFDEGEEGLAHVRVEVGSNSAMTDSSGLYRLWDVVPFEPVSVTADSLSFDSPLWVPAHSSMVVVAGPNRYTVVDIPVVMGSVLEGSVVRRFGAETQGIAGASLTLTEEATGRQRTMATFTDGTFYVLGVRPGRYVLTVDERVLDLLQVRAEPRRFTIDATGEGPGSIELLLTPRP